MSIDWTGLEGPHTDDIDAAVPVRGAAAKTKGRRGRLRRTMLAVGSSALAIGALGLPATASAQQVSPQSTTYRFTTLDDQADPTFNQLLGINDGGLIVGYFGSGLAGHPNKGYRLNPPYGQGNYVNENFPGSVQTQVTGVNGNGKTVGFWIDGKGVTRGFYRTTKGRYVSVQRGNGTVTQLLGINGSGVAVGFYTDAKNVNHGFVLNANTGRAKDVGVSGLTNITAAAINDHGDLAGFGTDAHGATVSFATTGGRTIVLQFSGSTNTMALGINDHGEVVGSYAVGQATHGFTWSQADGFRTVDDPNGLGTTTINGLNDQGQLVGFYVDGAGNTDGLLATP
ncbi:MAG: hypothetical protein JOZ64_06775 [Solirubrobacterales bacterium]|nr:hypothetical protein [Solirubrobacterales bacterium]